MDYQEALDYVASLAPRGWRLGLDRMRAFAHEAGLDDALGVEGSPQYIHIAGTNGKGSTTAYVQSLLHESGYRVGSFFSPYVYDPRERIQLGRELIPEKIFAGLTAMLKPIAEEFTETDFGGISEFEFKTAMAFLFYKRLRCEWVALEVGLGGRLDATNIVTPRCSIITSIGLDHVSILGNTLGEIAFEKAGIIKPGVPVICGQMPDEAEKVIQRVAEENGSQLWTFGREILLEEVSSESYRVTTPFAKHEPLTPGIRGAAQAHNMALAVASIDAVGAGRTLKGFTDGTSKASIPGRFELRRFGGKTILLDGAHNVDAALVLAASIDEELSPFRARLLFGMVEGHDVQPFLEPLREFVHAAYAVPIDFHRSRMPEELVGPARALGIPVLEFESSKAGLNAALADLGEAEFLLVTGSFYLVGEVGRTLDAMQP